MSKLTIKLKSDIQLADEIIAGKKEVPEEFAVFKDLVGLLKGAHEFGLARKLLATGRDQFVNLEARDLVQASVKGRQPMESTAEPVWLVQQQALCTYKDEELQPSKRFADALKLLEEIGLRDTKTTNAETLSLGGAVYRRIWEQNGQLDDLYRALSFYQAAWDRGKDDAERCYGGVNAAFIYDQMAFRLRGLAATEMIGRPEEGVQSINMTRAESYGSRAVELRKAIISQLEEWESKHGTGLVDYWFAVTRADAYFGLAMVNRELFGNAIEWYGKAAELLEREDEDEKEWRLQTTFKQALSLARLHGYVPSDQENWKPVGEVLNALLGEAATQALNCQRGKVGLALSGGGFRASFYHLGVMARLAEMDVLRGVDVLSTVSGGSIVGAHYYLEVQHLLQGKPDKDIERDDYIKLVKRVQINFLAGVQRNLRIRALGNFLANLRMIFNKSYSRTKRLGELYESELYSRVSDGHSHCAPRKMPDLLIKPETADAAGKEYFHPKYDNWRRAARAPVLLLNTTSLNTGHSWHFTASWMGEPPGLLDGDVDANERYRRLYYGEAPNDELKNFCLGYAVAASSCVPGLFEPISIPDLYEDRTVRLVDGGVHDNQGVEGLLDEGCTRILCSDASGQMSDENNPADNFIGVPLRSFSISQDRVREAEYQDLSARTDSQSLEGLFFIHLKKDLETKPIDWIGCTNPSVPLPVSDTTSYGINKDVQRLLANVRTDLDSFTEVEANALMLSGYLMTKSEFKQLQNQHEKEGRPGTWGGYDIDAPIEKATWEFLALENLMSQPKGKSKARGELEKQLKASAMLFFKIWKLSPLLKITAGAAAAILLLIASHYIYVNWEQPILPAVLREATWGWMILLVIGAVSAALLGPLGQLFNPTKAMRNKIIIIFSALAGWFFAKIHLCIFDNMFLKQGKLNRLLKMNDQQ